VKINGVINKNLMACLTGLGHTDSFIICDAGFPIPDNAVKIDLALTAGTPTMIQCLEAVLQEIVVEEFVVAEEMAKLDTKNFKYLLNVFKKQKRRIILQDDLIRTTKNVKFYVRTGDLIPYSNVILFAASGVDEYRNEFLVNSHTEQS